MAYPIAIAALVASISMGCTSATDETASEDLTAPSGSSVSDLPGVACKGRLTSDAAQALVSRFEKVTARDGTFPLGEHRFRLFRRECTRQANASGSPPQCSPWAERVERVTSNDVNQDDDPMWSEFAPSSSTFRKVNLRGGEKDKGLRLTLESVSGEYSKYTTPGQGPDENCWTYLTGEAESLSTQMQLRTVRRCDAPGQVTPRDMLTLVVANSCMKAYRVVEGPRTVAKGGAVTATEYAVVLDAKW